MMRPTHPDPAAVRTLRARLRWTPEQVADAVQATSRDVAAWEAGTVRVPPPRARRLRALAAVHGVRPGHLGYGMDSVPRALRILPLVAAAPVMVLLGAAVLAVDRFVLRPLLRRPRVNLVLALSIAVLTTMVTNTLRNPGAGLSPLLIAAVGVVLTVAVAAVQIEAAVQARHHVPGGPPTSGAAVEPEDETMEALTPAAGTVPVEEPRPQDPRGL